METPKKNTEKQPLYKRMLGAGLLLAIALYCTPELREKLCSYIEFLANEWRDRYHG